MPSSDLRRPRIRLWIRAEVEEGLIIFGGRTKDLELLICVEGKSALD